ncbi:pirin family protein [Kangiella marina]|uniref:Pirin family protein n=1 Tax=Kangiella marina TaxID=1079178 RepID=A0ABP8IB40_9GAMM
MSNLLQSKPDAECTDQPCSSIKQIIEPKEKDLGGFCVRRLFPAVGAKSVGPWVFFDHMGPATFSPGDGVNVRPHPHIGIATVTYVFEGEILHRDSLGSYQTITPGDINLMVAGKGIVHSERERPEVTQLPHELNGLQLWMALPIDSEEIEPEFHHYPSSTIPTVTLNGIKVRVMMGSAYGVKSPVKTFAETLYLECLLEPKDSLPMPKAEELAVYVAKGAIEIDGVVVEEYSMAVLNPTENLEIKSLNSSRVAIIGGENLGKRFMEWNFVSSSKERIEQAKRDWKEGRFPKVTGDEEEFIPLP